MTKHKKALDELKKRGYVKAVAEFSGGNDEGGVDDITLFREDGTEEDGPKHVYGYDYASSKKRDLTDEEKANNEFRDLLEAPVNDEYGSFAGDFSVQGSVTFDVKAGTVKMSKSEQTWIDEQTWSDEETSDL